MGRASTFTSQAWYKCGRDTRSNLHNVEMESVLAPHALTQEPNTSVVSEIVVIPASGNVVKKATTSPSPSKNTRAIDATQHMRKGDSALCACPTAERAVLGIGRRMRARFENGEGVGCPVPSTPITPAFAASGALEADRQKEGGGSAPGLTPPYRFCRQERRFRETSCRNSVCTDTAESQARMQPSHASTEGKQTQQHAREISRQSFYVNITRVWHLHTTIPALAALRNTQKSAGTISAARWYHATAALPHEGSSMHATTATPEIREQPRFRTRLFGSKQACTGAWRRQVILHLYTPERLPLPQIGAGLSHLSKSVSRSLHEIVF